MQEELHFLQSEYSYKCDIHYPLCGYSLFLFKIHCARSFLSLVCQVQRCLQFTSTLSSTHTIWSSVLHTYYMLQYLMPIHQNHYFQTLFSKSRSNGWWCWTTWHHHPEDLELKHHCPESLKTCICSAKLKYKGRCFMLKVSNRAAPASFSISFHFNHNVCMVL
jgi:hypothetical protein